MKCAVLKIIQFWFFYTRKVRCVTLLLSWFRYSVSEENSQCSKPHRKHVSSLTCRCQRVGSVSRDFVPLYFSWFKPIWDSENRLKNFWILIRFGQDIQFCFRNSAVYTSHRGVRLRSVHHNTESNSTVCIIPRSQTLRCAPHRRVRKPHISKTPFASAELSSMVCISSWSR